MGVDRWRLLSFEELFIRLDAQQDYLRDQAAHVADIMWGGGEESPVPPARNPEKRVEDLKDDDWYPRNN